MTIKRLDSSARSSQAVRHGETLYLSGQVAPGRDVTEQAKAVFAQIDALLARGGTDKSNILSASVWLSDMADFAAMNAIWDEWVADIDPPTRSTGELRLAAPEYRIEVIVVAAVTDSSSK